MVTLNRREIEGKLSQETAELTSVLSAVVRFNHRQPTAPVMGAFDAPTAPPLVACLVGGVKCEVHEVLSNGNRSVVVRGEFGGQQCVVKWNRQASNVGERKTYRLLIDAGVPHLPTEVRDTVFEPLANVVVQRDSRAVSLEDCCVRGVAVAKHVLGLLYSCIKISLEKMHAAGYLMVDLHIGNIVVLFKDGVVDELQLIDFESVKRLGDGETTRLSPVRRLKNEDLDGDFKPTIEFDKSRFAAVVNWVRQRGLVRFSDCAPPIMNDWWATAPAVEV